MNEVYVQCQKLQRARLKPGALKRSKREIRMNIDKRPLLTCAAKAISTWVPAFVSAIVFATPAAYGNPAQPPNQDPAAQIMNLSSRKPVDALAFMHDAASANFVLLGETHGNPAHHRIQAQVLQALIDKGKKPALVMEQFDLEQQEEIDRIVGGGTTQQDMLMRLTGLIGKGWEAPAYRPLLEIALRSSLPIVAANLSRESAREVGKKGFAMFGTAETNRLMLEGVWQPAKQALLTQTIRDSHCGMLPEAAVTGMVHAQRARDSVMADRLLPHRQRGAVGIFGRGHVDKEMAVPLYLAARDTAARTIAVAMIERDASGNQSKAGSLSSLEDTSRYDYVWLTPSTAENGNPCDAFVAPPPPAK